MPLTLMEERNWQTTEMTLMCLFLQLSFVAVGMECEVVHGDGHHLAPTDQGGCLGLCPWASDGRGGVDAPPCQTFPPNYSEDA
jgi:hypothetical protein